MDHAANAGAGPKRPKTDSTPLVDHCWLVAPGKAVVFGFLHWESGSLGVVGNGELGGAFNWSGACTGVLGGWVGEY